jgi:hypothetical protein
MLNKPTVVITHHTGGTDANPLADTSGHTVDIINEWHKKRWPDFVSRLGYHVGYHYFIDRQGNITQTREHSEEGAHCIGMNRSSIGVCFAGNFDLTLPTAKQLVAWNRLYKKLRLEFPNIPTFPHRRYASKSCHGKRLSDTYFTFSNQNVRTFNLIEQITLRIASLLSGKRM